MATQPAFTSVSVQQPLTARQPPAPTAVVGFPQAVTNYVQRAFFEFNRVKDNPTYAGITDKDIRAKLSEIVTQARNNGEIDGRDWLLQPLPHECVLQDRQQAALSRTQVPMTANRAPLNGSLPHALPPSGPYSNKNKRKSPDTDMTERETKAITPPWKKTATTASLLDRANVKSKNAQKKRKGADKLRGNAFDSSMDALEKRKQRFGNISPDSSPYVSSRDESPYADPHAGPTVGTCQILEKSYFRLTAPPNPNTVRPLPVLEQALRYVIQRWEERHDYNYVCDQLKSIRQDLTVQRIKAPFTIRVYEVHARIALSMKDLGEYNQCQTQLRALYKLRLGGDGGSGGNDDEFLAYRILYLIYTNNRADMNNMLADLTLTDKRKPFASFALQVRAALASGNYHKLLKLYQKSPSIGLTWYLMAMFIERERLTAMSAICKAYKPDIGLDYLTAELGFSADSQFEGPAASQLCNEFIRKYQGDTLLQRKEDGEFRILVGKAGSTFEDAKKVSFGKVDIKGQI